MTEFNITGTYIAPSPSEKRVFDLGVQVAVEHIYSFFPENTYPLGTSQTRGYPNMDFIVSRLAVHMIEGGWKPPGTDGQS